METIKEKLRKIKALADKGIDFEAKAAQFQLEKLLSKYNLSIEDIFDETKKPRMFKVRNLEKRLFIQNVAAVIGNRWREIYYYNGKPSEKYIEMTDQEFVDFEQQFSFHRKQLKKECKKAFDELIKAYCYKHDLFNKDISKDDRQESIMSLDDYFSILQVVEKLENVTFRKQLSE